MQNVLINRQQLSAPQLAKWHTFTAPKQIPTHTHTCASLDGWRIEEVDDAFSDHQKLFNSDLVPYDLSAILQQSIKTICRRQHRRTTATTLLSSRKTFTFRSDMMRTAFWLWIVKSRWARDSNIQHRAHLHLVSTSVRRAFNYDNRATVVGVSFSFSSEITLN